MVCCYRECNTIYAEARLYFNFGAMGCWELNPHVYAVASTVYITDGCMNIGVDLLLSGASLYC